ncbi:MAG: N-acetyltransferase [Planctomycetota bacterium]
MSNETIEIRPERNEDENGIRTLLALSFPTPAEADLVDALRGSAALAVSLVATHGARVVGHVAASEVELDGGPAVRALGLAPLAVCAGHRRRGIGADLVRASIDASRTLGAEFLVLLGEPAYYARFGFRPARTWGLCDTFGGGDAFQALELVHGAVPRAGGTVRYRAEFDALG